jgi:NSS family neurotransmitter:Na+ symporter
MSSTPQHESWTSRWTFILAAIGGAVGLGNIWKFPYITGANGGGAFVIVYLFSVLAVAIPILSAELMIGRRGQRSPSHAMVRVAQEEGGSHAWAIVGWLGVLSGSLILSFYSVIAGWAMAYVFKTAIDPFTGQGTKEVAAVFDTFLASPVELSLWHGAFMVLTVYIVSRGIRRGIERAVEILMPVLFVMLLGIVGYSAVAGDFTAGLRFLFQVDFTKINAEIVLIAIGQAFFSIGVAMGLMMTYGAYLQKDVSIVQVSFMIAGADTLVALLAGVAIFPLVFANGLDPADGPGLIFNTLPIAFGNMPGGTFIGTVFFVLLTFAALTSSIAILEPVVSWAEEHRDIRRATAAVVSGLIAWLIGLMSVFSFNIWDDVRPLGAFHTFQDKTIFDLLDYLTANLMMPVGGLLIALFAGWRISRTSSLQELGMADTYPYQIWLFLIRFVAPLAICAILVTHLA